MIVVVAAADADRAMQALAAEGESVYRVGAVVVRAPGAPATVVV
jgi:phosphoribosylaminoimidazole (AIR) synthetase